MPKTPMLRIEVIMPMVGIHPDEHGIPVTFSHEKGDTIEWPQAEAEKLIARKHARACGPLAGVGK